MKPEGRKDLLGAVGNVGVTPDIPGVRIVVVSTPECGKGSGGEGGDRLHSLLEEMAVSL